MDSLQWTDETGNKYNVWEECKATCTEEDCNMRGCIKNSASDHLIMDDVCKPISPDKSGFDLNAPGYTRNKFDDSYTTYDTKTKSQCESMVSGLPKYYALSRLDSQEYGKMLSQIIAEDEAEQQKGYATM